jgi:two-component system, cell cycle sensor histidine kinase and response regulator CckA
MNDTETVPRTGCTLPLRAVMKHGAEQTILLVEDETFVRNVTCKVLEDEGYIVLKSSSARAAKAAMSAFKNAPQLLLTDVVLPDQNGYALAADLRKINPELRAVFMSGYPKQDDQETGDDGTFYLPKPFSSQALLRVVRHAFAAEMEVQPSGAFPIAGGL